MRLVIPMSKPLWAGALSFLTLVGISTYITLHQATASQATTTTRVKRGNIQPYLSITGKIGNHQVVSLSSSTVGQVVRWGRLYGGWYTMVHGLNQDRLSLIFRVIRRMPRFIRGQLPSTI